MTRRLRRHPSFELSLVIQDDGFIRPPREMQRNALLNKALKEFSDDLTALDKLADRFVPGSTDTALEDRTRTELSDDEIMEDWQIPIMRAMAGAVTERKGDILEIGFGRGISSTFIQDLGVRSHTIIECNDSIVERFHAWKQDYPDRDIRLVHGKWQDMMDSLDRFDGIFFHTYPLNQEEYMAYVSRSVTFAEHFFPTAAAHLRQGGAFTYFSNEIDSLSRAHQRLLFRYFSAISLQVVQPLNLPNDVRDTWWADSMVVVKAIK